MSTPSLPTGAGLEHLLERIEIAQYEDFFDALPVGVSEHLGIELRRDHGTLRLTATGYDRPFFNRVMGIGLDPEVEATGPEAVLKRAAAHYGAAGVRRWMLQILPHVEPAGFEETAGRLGIIRLRGWAKHIGSTDREIASRSELRVVRLDAAGAEADGRAASLVEAWQELAVRNFEFPLSFAPWLRALHGRERWHLYLALDGETPVATGALFLSESEVGAIGELTFASTLPEHRRRGAQSALVARRVADARAAGARWVVSETDEERPERPNPSTRNLVRLGLPVAYVRTNWGPPKPER
jgi:hypothetical protein